MIVKKVAKVILTKLHLDVTNNIRYDRLTEMILKIVIQKSSNCIDIGCHTGEILNHLLKLAPEGQHYAFEPIPGLFASLQKKYAGKAVIFPFALADENGRTTFNFVRNAPAYSGIRQRKYAIKNPDIETLQVEKKKLDAVISPDVKIDFIKIDVEGAEFEVLKGAARILKDSKPLILFECGLGGSDYYGVKPQSIYDYLVKKNHYNIYTLNDWLKRRAPLSLAQFTVNYDLNKEYYFIAQHQDKKFIAIPV
jgi:FkbM family methyltransferase